METKVCPCKGCVAPKRHSGCHVVCPEYKEWNDERQQELAKIRDAKHAEFVSCPSYLWKNRKRRKD